MKFHIYKDSAGGWRWRLVADNNRIVADSAESYTRRVDVKRAIRAVIDGVIHAKVAMGIAPLREDT